MSHTTDITLLLGVLDDQELESFNEALGAAGVAFDRDTPPLRSLATAVNALPGSKYYTNSVAAACWNHSSAYVPILVSVFQAYPWDSPQNAVLVVADEQVHADVIRPLAYGGAQ